MREIRFRRWDENGRCWLKQATTFVTLSDNGTLRTSTDHVGKARYCLLSQFTELKDRDGKDIYEGDIILHGQSIRFVEYRNGNPCITTIQKTESMLLSFSHNTDAIIGNIYENPELLDPHPKENNQ